MPTQKERQAAKQEAARQADVARQQQAFERQSLGDFYQQVISASMANRVVDALEVVKVDKQERRIGLAALAAFDYPVQLLIEAASIG